MRVVDLTEQLQKKKPANKQTKKRSRRYSNLGEKRTLKNIQT